MFLEFRGPNTNGVPDITLSTGRNVMKRGSPYLVSFVLALCVSSVAVAQPGPPNPADSVQTVTVAADHSVTFSLYAPKASVVTVSGDFPVKGPVPMTKGDDGVWAFTTPPLPPDSYTYNFSVDGLNVLDQHSQNFRENPNSLFNYFDMPGPETDFMALKNVAHGRVEKVLYHSSTLNMERRIHVYLPPNFEKLKGPLPVFYLLHGFGDNDISWTSAGKINLILDNLYAAGKLKNMVVVMPAGHVPSPPGTPFLAFSPNPEGDLFVQDFLKDLMPFVAKTYPVSTKRDDTAIAGFSMGGGQALKLALFHPELFGYLFPISTGFFPQGLTEMEEKYSAQLK